MSDFEEEAGVIAVAVGHAFEDFDLVVDAFQNAGVRGPAAVGEEAVYYCPKTGRAVKVDSIPNRRRI